jgi:hypothetical protein
MHAEPKFQNAAVASRFSGYPDHARERLLQLRGLIFEVAKGVEGLGAIEESLKWGEPAYRPRKANTGTTVRIDWKPANPEYCAMYFHCQTNLVETFRAMFPQDFVFEGNRALLIGMENPIPGDAVAFCVSAAFTYHLQK